MPGDAMDEMALWRYGRMIFKSISGSRVIIPKIRWRCLVRLDFLIAKQIIRNTKAPPSLRLRRWCGTQQFRGDCGEVCREKHTKDHPNKEFSGQHMGMR